MTERFNNTLNITKHIFKREWKTALVWLVILIGITIAVAAVFSDLYGTPEERLGMAETMSNPAMVAMVGPAYGLDNYTQGVMYAQMMILFSILAVATMNIFLVVKHTRKDEESGRLEVIKSLPVGRASDLLATMIVCIGINLVLALITGFGLYFLNIETMDLGGSLLYGASLGISGILFGGIAALFAQIASTSRGAIGYSVVFLGVMYMIRAIGDVGENILSYISPLGIVMKTEIYYANYWWPILILLGLAVVMFLLAFKLNGIRDLGAGLVAAKPGRKEASNLLQTPLGLSMRLLKPTFIGWAIAVFLLGISYGSVFGDIEVFLEGSELMQQIFLNNDKFTFAEQFLTTLMMISAIMITVPTLIVMIKIRNEEKKGRLEHIYSKKISRSSILKNQVMLSIGTSIDMTILFALGLWVAAYYSMAEPISFLTVFKAGLVYLPAMWLMIGITVLLIGFVPKFTNFIWGLLGGFFFLVYIGTIIGIPAWLINSTPYGAIPQIPVEEFNIVPLIILTILAIVMFIIGFYGYSKRDIINQ